MRNYELMFIMKPEEDDAVNACVEKVKSWISDTEGVIKKVRELQ